MTHLRSERGQVTVITAIFMLALIGLGGFVLDVGSWFRQQRLTQSNVDAAALAGAQALPANPATAYGLAQNYAAKNAGVAGAQITFSTKYTPNDTIKVTQSRPASGLFAKVLGFSSVTVHAHAAAISEVPSAAMGVAPVGVWIGQEMLSGTGCPCFNKPTTLPLGKKGAPGAFGLIDLDVNDKGTTGASTLATWIEKGYNQYLPLGGYFSDPGVKFENSNVQGAFDDRYGTDLLFPVYDTLVGGGAGAKYHVIGWAAFHLTNAVASGNDGTLYGWFDRVIWDGIVSTSGPSVTTPDLGVHSVALID